MTTKSPKKFSTIAIESDVAKKFASLEIDFHGINVDNNSQKLNALIELYKQNYKTFS